SLDRSQGGLGIGLTLVRHLVELHGGRVEARSEGLGKGSEFVIWLPVAPDAESKSEPAAPNALDGVTSAQRCRVLVVADNVDTAESMVVLLKLDSHDVRVAYDGLSAVESAQSFRPHVVLLGIGLSHLDRHEMAPRLPML